MPCFLSLVEFLRQRGLVGTKIGCAEGDCGACTVLAGHPEHGSLRYQTIVSCIQPVHQLDGMHVVTIEGVCHDGDSARSSRRWSSIMARSAGFARRALSTHSRGFSRCANPIDDDVLRASLAGNLCRCTGYEPILAAGLSVDPTQVRRLSSLYSSPAIAVELAACREVPILIETGPGFFSARLGWRRPSLFARASRRRHRGRRHRAGRRAQQKGPRAAAILSLAGISELAKITIDGNVLSVGANVTWARSRHLRKASCPRSTRSPSGSARRRFAMSPRWSATLLTARP